MRTDTINIYTFNELSKEAQAKAIDTYRDNNEMEFMPEAMREYAHELLSDSNITKFDDFKVYYSLNSCQGDGAQIIMRARYRDYYVNIKPSGHYSHMYATNIDIYDEYHDDAPEAIYDAFKEEYYALCEKLENFGYQYIDAENDDANIIETIEANDYEFTADGKRY